MNCYFQLQHYIPIKWGGGGVGDIDAISFLHLFNPMYFTIELKKLKLLEQV